MKLRYQLIIGCLIIMASCNLGNDDQKEDPGVGAGAGTDPGAGAGGSAGGGAGYRSPPKVFSVQTMAAYQTLLNMSPVILDAAKVHLWPGLANVGNTCYMNSTLKLMARQRELLAILDTQAGENAEIANLRQALKAVINMIRLADLSPANAGDKAKDNDLKVYALQSLRKRMNEVTTSDLKRFTNCSQEDADDFYASLANALNFSPATPNNLSITVLADKISATDDKIANPRLSTEGAVSISPSLSVNTDAVTTTKLLTEFTNAEVDPTRTALYYKKIYFLNLDESIILTIKTTFPDGTGGQKIRDFFTNPQEEITIGHLNSVLPTQTDLNNLINHTYTPLNPNAHLPNTTHDKKFRLTGVVVHSGSPRGGHYWAYIKDDSTDANKGWYRQDDNSAPALQNAGGPLGAIEQRSGSDINPQAYLYLYEAIP